MHDPLDLQRHIDQLCNQFEEQWEADSPPEISSWLGRIEPPHRSDLMQALLLVELELRGKAGQLVTPQDYLALGPEAVAIVEKLLRVWAADHLQTVDIPLTDELRSQLRDEPSQQIGPYKLLQQIGEGGMGTVWMAEQERPIKRRVALKLIKSGLDNKQVIARFEAERQALSMMDHQNIARVIDAGMTGDGRPYFAMELVQGIPLTQYCDQNKLSINERLELFISVCSAVQHAHQKGIIHRDLKPSNVLVSLYDGKPVPKVIDFGLAKALQHTTLLTDKTLFTEFGQVVGTLQYMSPEQAEMNQLDIDTRTDIYSLGVMLYELLTGSTPIERSTLQQQAILKVLETIREQDPPRPSVRLSSNGHEAAAGISEQRRIEASKLKYILRGELDWVVMKALEKDRTRRYETANGVALEIQRYLGGDPVRARPPSRSYLLRKYVRKNKGQVIAASLVFLSLIAGTVAVLAVQARANSDLHAVNSELKSSNTLLDEQRARAEEREQEAIDAVKGFGDAVSGNDTLKNNPALEELRKTLLKEPLAFFQKLRDQLQGDKDTRPESLGRLASAVFDLGKLTNEIGDKEDALRAYRESLAIRERLARENPTVTLFQSNLANSLNNIGSLLSDTGKPAEALASYEQARAIQDRLARENPTVTEFQSNLAGSHFNIGRLLSATGKTAEALVAYERALAIKERLARENPSVTGFQSDLAVSHSNIGSLLSDTGKTAEAKVAHEQARVIQERLARENPTVSEFQRGLASSHNNLGDLLRTTGKPAEALAAHEQALAIRERLARENPSVTGFQSDLAVSHDNLGRLLDTTGKPAEALAAHEQARVIQERLARENPESPDFASSLGGVLSNMAGIDVDARRFAEAREKCLQAIEWQRKALAANPRNPSYRQFLTDHLSNLIRACKGLGDAEGAADARRQLAELQASDPRFAKLGARLDAIADGALVEDKTERLTLAQRAYDAERYAMSVRLWSAALKFDPLLENDRTKQHAYNAACAAALAGCGQGVDASPLDETAKATLRKQALDWLRAELAEWTTLLASGPPEAKGLIVTKLKHWQTDTELAGVRDEKELAKLPADEQQSFSQLWADVAELLTKAEKRPQPE